MRRKPIAGTLLILTVLTAAQAAAMAEPVVEPPSTEAGNDPTVGLIVVRGGGFEGTIADDPYLLGDAELSLQVQPWRGREGLHRDVFAGVRAGGWTGDFTAFERRGIELGYLYQTVAVLRWVRVGASVAGTFDRWSVWRDDDDRWQGDASAIGFVVRPLLRLWRLELSVPLELGYGFGPGESYRTRGFQVGVVLF